MTDWDSFTACVATKEERFADLLRADALRTFEDNKPAAMAAVKAIVDWWARLDTKIKAVLTAGAGAIGKKAWDKIAASIVAAGIAGNAAVVGKIAAVLAIIAAGFTFGSVLAASADCLDEA